MYTTHTFQDWEETSEADRLPLLLDIIRNYKASAEFQHALKAEKYFRAENEAVGRKKLLKPQKFVTETVEQTSAGERKRTRNGVRSVEIDGNRVYSRFFYRVVTQENQHLLGSGVTLGDVGDISGEAVKSMLGVGFDTALQKIGEKALIDGVCWGYWNLDHLEVIEAVRDESSGFVALLDEVTSAPKLGVQFWRLAANRPLYVRLFDEDGVTVYRTNDGGELEEYEPYRPYVLHVARDTLGEQVISTSNYGVLPVIPLYANPEQRSELDNSLLSKIDAYDRISSDFVDNLDRANDVYWVLNNFGGNTAEICQMIEQIEKLRVVASVSDGVSSSTAQPHTLEVPYAARQTALTLLEGAIYKDAMALSLDEVTGGGLTNVAIKAAMTNLNLKCDRYEWQCFAFVQAVLKLLRIETESISFVRQEVVNQSEVVSDIALMRDYIDDETALRLNPYIPREEIDVILERLAQQRYTGTPYRVPDLNETSEEGTNDGSADEDLYADREGDAGEY